MTITLAHTFVSAKSQGVDATVVSKNEWNAAHSLTMATGAILARTTAATGAVEEIVPNSTDFTMATGTLARGPGIITVLSADFVGTDVNTAQPVFAAAQDTFTAEATTDYTFDSFYHITRAAGTNSHTTSVLFGGTATFTGIRYVAMVSNPTGNALSAVNSIVGDVATAIVLTAANTSATENLIIRLVGNMRINGVGTVIPQFQFSAAPGGAPTVKLNSFFRMHKIGTNAVTVGGSWA
jgi:hypothetical protein